MHHGRQEQQRRHRGASKQHEWLAAQAATVAEARPCDMARRAHLLSKFAFGCELRDLPAALQAATPVAPPRLPSFHKAPESYLYRQAPAEPRAQGP